MPVSFVRVRNTKTRAVTALPESALAHLTDWERVDGPVPARPKPALNGSSNRSADIASATDEKE
jgi:hypothetical protein